MRQGVLLPYQKRWHEDKSPVKVWKKSRRIGASWGEAADDVVVAAAKSGSDVNYIGYNKDMARQFISDCAFWAKNYTLAASEMEEFVFKENKEDEGILAFRIKFASGFEITALSSRPRSLRGIKGIVVIDEAAFHDDLPGLIKAAIAILMWGGKVRILSTDFGEDNPFNELVNDIRSGKVPFSLHVTTFDDALADGLYKRICEVTGKEWSQEAEAKYRQDMIDFYGDDADEELFCIPSKGTGVWLPRVLIEQCMDKSIPVLRWQRKAEFATAPEAEREEATAAWLKDNLDPLLRVLDKNRAHYFGEDFGRSGDLTVLWPIAAVTALTFRTPFIIELRNVPFEQQKQILFHMADNLPRFQGGALDARGNGQWLAEICMQRYGESRIEQVMLTENFYRDVAPKYKSALEERSITLPDDADVMDDHRAVKMVRGIAKIPENARTKGSDKGQRHGDTWVAAVLAWYARDIEYQELSYETVTGSRTKFGTGTF